VQSLPPRQPFTPQSPRLGVVTIEEMHHCQGDLVIRGVEDSEIRHSDPAFLNHDCVPRATLQGNRFRSSAIPPLPCV
jgi:hypothetical protein